MWRQLKTNKELNKSQFVLPDCTFQNLDVLVINKRVANHYKSIVAYDDNIYFAPEFAI